MGKKVQSSNLYLIAESVLCKRANRVTISNPTATISLICCFSLTCRVQLLPLRECMSECIVCVFTCSLLTSVCLYVQSILVYVCSCQYVNQVYLQYTSVLSSESELLTVNIWRHLQMFL